MSSRASDIEEKKNSQQNQNLFGTSQGKEINERFLDFLKDGIDEIPENYLAIIKKIHGILADSPDLTSQQKLEFCNIERFFMKSYLKEFISRNYKSDFKP